MTKRELLAMALKFVGIVYGLHAISSFLIELRTWSQFIAHGITNFTNLDVNDFWAIGITSCLINISFSFALIRWGDWLARWMFRKDASVLPAQNEAWERCLFDTTLKFLGSLYFLWGFSSLVTDGICKAFHWSIVKSGKDSFMIYLPANLRTILIGLALFALSRLVVTFAYRRAMGKVTPNNAD